MERERDTEKRLRREIERLGGTLMKFVSPGNDGVPDRVALLPDGRIFFVELKAPAGKLSPVQKFQIAKLRKLGQTVRIVYGREGAEELLADLRREVKPHEVHTS